MTFEEIISRLRSKDGRVTDCFFFWDGPTMERIEAVRRVDPIKAQKMRRPICNTCRPALLAVLHKLYGTEHFDYDELVSDFYYYLIKDDKLGSIRDPQTLMSWISTTAYYFFLHEKINKDRVLENTPVESLTGVHEEIEEDEAASSTRTLVQNVLDAMPNRTYARILDEVILEAWQYSGRQKSDLLKKKAEEMGIPIDNMYVKISLAKKQFKETAKKMNLQ